LRRLGTALHVVQNRLIVRGEPVGDNWTGIPRTNSIVVDQKRMKIGRILDIFGPVKHPFIVVRTNRGTNAAVHVGKKLYVDDMSGRDGNKWR
jgi:RNA-binding protein